MCCNGMCLSIEIFYKSIDSGSAYVSEYILGDIKLHSYIKPLPKIETALVFLILCFEKQGPIYMRNAYCVCWWLDDARIPGNIIRGFHEFSVIFHQENDVSMICNRSLQPTSAIVL